MGPLYMGHSTKSAAASGKRLAGIDRKNPLNLLLLRSCYVFWKMFPDFYHLFGMANLMGRNKPGPIIKIQRPEKRMPPAVNATVTSMCLFQECQCPFADTSQFREHGFLAGKQHRLERNGAFLFDEAAFHQRQRQMKALEKRHWQ